MASVRPLFHLRWHHYYVQGVPEVLGTIYINPLNAELNPICHLLALLGDATIVVVSRLRVKQDNLFAPVPKLIFSPPSLSSALEPDCVLVIREGVKRSACKKGSTAHTPQSLVCQFQKHPQWLNIRTYCQKVGCFWKEVYKDWNQVVKTQLFNTDVLITNKCTSLLHI